MSIKDYDLTPANNATVPGINMAEGMPPGDVNDGIRQIMADIRRSWEQLELATWGGTSTGAANTYEVTPVIGITVVAPVYTAGAMYAFISHQANTGAATLDVSAVGATAIQYAGSALTGGEIPASGVVAVVYDGTAFQLVSPQPASTGTAPTIQVFTVSGTWTKPAGLLYADIEWQAPGGGAGGCDSTLADRASGGGGAGGSGRKHVAAATLGATETVTIGAIGAGGIGVAGTAGGSVSFGAHGSATGGIGGAVGAGGNSAGGAGGTSTGGDVNRNGQDGADGRGDLVLAGDGGDSAWGFGGRATNTLTAKPGVDYGGGGGGLRQLAASSTNLTGGDGAAGIVIVTEHYA